MKRDHPFLLSSVPSYLLALSTSVKKLTQEIERWLI